MLPSTTGSEYWFIEGVRSDRGADPSVIDSMFVGGHGQAIAIQNYHALGIHGTDRSKYFGGVENSAQIVRIDVAGGLATAEITGAFPEGGPITGRDIIIGGTAYNGTDTTPIRNFNYSWTIGTVVDPTHFRLSIAADNVVPPNGSFATGGTVWMMQAAAGIHGDGLQLDTGSSPGKFLIDKCTFKGNSRGIIVQQLGPQYRFSRCNTDLDLSLNPQDSNAFAFWGGGTYDMDFYQFWVETRTPPSGIGKRNLEDNINPQTGIATVVGSERRVSFLEPNITGYLNQGVPLGGDFAVYDDLGVAYVSPGYVDFPTPQSGDITDITVDNLTATTALAENGHIGWVDIVHTLTGQIVDVYISSGDTTRVKILGRDMVRGAVALQAGSLSFQLTATVRGTGITFGPKTFAVEVT